MKLTPAQARAAQQQARQNQNAQNNPDRNNQRDPKPAPVKPTVDVTPALNTRQQNAYNAMVQTLIGYGFDTSSSSSIAAVIKQGLLEGHKGSGLQSYVEASDPWKIRFAGNEARIKNGLAVLSPSEYLQTEAAYKNVLDSFGLPPGFKDGPDALSKWIGDDVSPAEVSGRIATATDRFVNADQASKDALRAYYGMSDGDMLAYMIDGKNALALISQRANAVDFGAEQQRQGLAIADQARAERMGALGITAQGLSQGLSQVAQNVGIAAKLSAIDHTNVGQTDLEDAFLASDATAIAKVNKLASQERARFSGSTGIGQGSLSAAPKGSY